MDRFIKGIIDNPADLKRAAVENRKEVVEVSCPISEIESYKDNGFELFKELKRKAKLRRPITNKERLYRKTWILLYLLGYPEIRKNTGFSICTNTKTCCHQEFDIYAKDDETVLIGHCVALDNPQQLSTSDLILRFSAQKGDISKSIKGKYGNTQKLKIIWVVTTQNVIWSKEERTLAEQNNIHIITEKELRYFLQIAEHLRDAARYQFLAEFLKDQKIPALQNRKVPAIRGTLGGRKFYAFVSHPRELLKISFVNHRSLNDPDGAPSYQRLVSKSRLKKISNFISAGGFFPTNILINFVNPVRFEHIAKDDETGVSWGNLYLPDKYRSAWIIDGQHRLYGFSTLNPKLQSQNVVVLAFEKLPTCEEANLFVTINHEQVSVPKTLLDDLEGELKWESEKPTERVGALSARLISVLNSDIGEPLFGRVTAQGISGNDSTCLTVPAAKQALVKSGLLGRATLKNKIYELGPLCDASDTLTIERSREFLNCYLAQIRDANPKVWNSGRLGYLCTNTGIQALIQLASSIISFMESKSKLDAKELSIQELIIEIEPYTTPYLDYLKKQSIQTMEQDFKVQFGSGGPKEYYYRLCSIIKERHDSFSPEGMERWEEESSEDKISTADRKLKEINIIVQLAIFSKLKEVYGNDYWDKGITDKEMKTSAYRKSLDDEGNNIPLENYLDFISYKKIAEKKENWQLMRPMLNIADPGEKETAKNLAWMDRINELRRIPAHATAQRSYKSEDFTYIDYIHSKLEKKIPTDIWEQA